MKHMMSMRVLERPSEIARNVQSAPSAEAAISRSEQIPNEGGQGAALNQLHGHVRPAIKYARVHDADDVRVVERGTDSRLTGKPGQELFAHGGRMPKELRHALV